MQNTSSSKSLSNQAKTRSVSKWLFFVLIFGILASTVHCANIQQPTGGPRDSIPPKLLSELPTNLSTNFSDKKIVLNFDEFIRLSNPSREISISPDMDRFPEFKANRRSLEITLPDSLAENTTYVINFGRAIADNNEGNALTNYSYVFSTGNQIDSLSISGKVINAETNEPEFQTSVILIPIAQDSIFGKRKANIFATTDSSGNFKLNYLREDTYRIYALKEQNNDRIYNNPEESLGFIADSIHLQSDTSNILLWLSKARPENFRIADRKIEPNGQITLGFNKELKQPSVRITSPDSLDLSKRVAFNTKKDSAFIWVSHLTFDSIKIQISERDSLLDSVLIRRPSSDRYNRNIIISNNLSRNKVNLVKHLELYSTIPIQSMDRSKIILTEDSLAITNYQLQKDTANHQKMILRYNWKPRKNYSLTLQNEAFSGYFNEINEQIVTNFTLDEADRYGHLSFHISVPDTGIQYLIHLIDEKNTEILQTDIITQNTTLEYKNFIEGKYRLKVVYDENLNGEWDPGNHVSKTQPERIWYYNKIFNIRPNWEQEENISIPSITENRQILPISTAVRQ